jgi:ABC-type antimicrobial peptide transport system permease subunit
VSDSATSRAREFGVRLALGARPRGVQRLVLTEALLLVITGIAIGGLAATGAAHAIRALLFAVSSAGCRQRRRRHCPGCNGRHDRKLVAGAAHGPRQPGRRAASGIGIGHARSAPAIRGAKPDEGLTVRLVAQIAFRLPDPVAAVVGERNPPAARRDQLQDLAVLARLAHETKHVAEAILDR